MAGPLWLARDCRLHDSGLHMVSGSCKCSPANAPALTVLLRGTQVRPDFAEASLMHAYRTSSMRDHLLARYRNAFAAIVLAQLRNKGFKDGMQVSEIK